MARIVKVALGPHFDEFIQACIVSGRYNSVSEVVCAGLKLLEEDEVRLSAIRSALIEGEESGILEVPQEVIIAIEQWKRGEGIEVDIDSLYV